MSNIEMAKDAIRDYFAERKETGLRHRSPGLGAAGDMLHEGPLTWKLLNIQFGLELLLGPAAEALVEGQFLDRCQGGYCHTTRGASEI